MKPEEIGPTLFVSMYADQVANRSRSFWDERKYQLGHDAPALLVGSKGQRPERPNKRLYYYPEEKESPIHLL